MSIMADSPQYNRPLTNGDTTAHTQKMMPRQHSSELPSPSAKLKERFLAAASINSVSANSNKLVDNVNIDRDHDYVPSPSLNNHSSRQTPTHHGRRESQTSLRRQSLQESQDGQYPIDHSLNQSPVITNDNNKMTIDQLKDFAVHSASVIKNQEETIDRMSEKIRELEESKEEASYKIEKHDEKIEEQGRKIEEINRLSEKIRELEEFKKEILYKIKNHDDKIEEHDDKIEEHDGKIEEHSGKIEEYDAKFEKLIGEIANLQAIVQSIQEEKHARAQAPEQIVTFSVEEIELLCDNLESVSKKANEVDGVKTQVELIKQRLKRVETQVQNTQSSQTLSGDTPQRRPSVKEDEVLRRLYVGNLYNSIDEQELRNFFEGYNIESVDLPVNPGTNFPVGYAFVVLETAAEAERAVEELPGKNTLPSKVSIQLARKPSNPSQKNGSASGSRTRLAKGNGDSANIESLLHDLDREDYMSSRQAEKRKASNMSPPSGIGPRNETLDQEYRNPESLPSWKRPRLNEASRSNSAGSAFARPALATRHSTGSTAVYHEAEETESDDLPGARKWIGGGGIFSRTRGNATQSTPRSNPSQYFYNTAVAPADDSEDDDYRPGQPINDATTARGARSRGRGRGSRGGRRGSRGARGGRGRGGRVSTNLSRLSTPEWEEPGAMNGQEDGVADAEKAAEPSSARHSSRHAPPEPVEVSNPAAPSPSTAPNVPPLETPSSGVKSEGASPAVTPNRIMRDANGVKLRKNGTPDLRSLRGRKSHFGMGNGGSRRDSTPTGPNQASGRGASGAGGVDMNGIKITKKGTPDMRSVNARLRKQREGMDGFAPVDVSAFQEASTTPSQPGNVWNNTTVDNNPPSGGVSPAAQPAAPPRNPSTQTLFGNSSAQENNQREPGEEQPYRNGAASAKLPRPQTFHWLPGPQGKAAQPATVETDDSGSATPEHEPDRGGHPHGHPEPQSSRHHFNNVPTNNINTAATNSVNTAAAAAFTATTNNNNNKNHHHHHHQSAQASAQSSPEEKSASTEEFPSLDNLAEQTRRQKEHTGIRSWEEEARRARMEGEDWEVRQAREREVERRREREHVMKARDLAKAAMAGMGMGVGGEQGNRTGEMEMDMGPG